MEGEEQELRIAALLDALDTEHARVREAIAELKSAGASLHAAVKSAAGQEVATALQALQGNINGANQVLVRMQRHSLWRAAMQHAMVALVAILITLGAVWVYVPSKSEIESLRAERAQLQATTDTLFQNGGGVQHTLCGKKKRLCVRVDASAGKFGDPKQGETYMIAEGY